MTTSGTAVFVLINNRTAKQKISFCCGKYNAAEIVAWYAAYYSGDDYSVRIDGKLQKLDANGEIKNAK